MSFGYNNGVPNGPNDPSVDQPDMLTNTKSIQNLIKVDHVDFNNTDGGKHKQVTLPNLNVPVAQAGVASTIFSNSGVALGANGAQLFLANSTGTLPLSLIKCYGVFAVAAGNGNVTPINQVNIVGDIVQVGRTYTVNMTPNVTNGTTFGVIAMAPGTSDAMGWTGSANQVVLRASTSISTGDIITFIVLQA